MQSRKTTSLKAICYTLYHVTIATLIFSTIVYWITGNWEYEYLEKMGAGLIAYIAWEFAGYYIFERIWNNQFFRRIK